MVIAAAEHRQEIIDLWRHYVGFTYAQSLTTQPEC